MRDSHMMIIHHIRQVIGGKTVCFNQDRILKAGLSTICLNFPYILPLSHDTINKICVIGYEVGHLQSNDMRLSLHGTVVRNFFGNAGACSVVVNG